MPLKDIAARRQYWRERYLANAESIADRRREQYARYEAENRPARKAWRDANRSYLSKSKNRHHHLMQSLVSDPRTEPWTTAEEEIALREDLSVKEKCVILQRSYKSVLRRRSHLRKVSA